MNKNDLNSYCAEGQCFSMEWSPFPNSSNGQLVEVGI